MFRMTRKESYGERKVHYTALVKDGITGEHVTTNTGLIDFRKSYKIIHSTDFKMEKGKTYRIELELSQPWKKDTYLSNNLVFNAVCEGR